MEAPEAIVARNDRKCKNSVTVTILEATGEGGAAQRESSLTITTAYKREIPQYPHVYFTIDCRVSPDACATDDRERLHSGQVFAFNTDEESVFNVEPEDQIHGIGMLIRFLFYCDNVTSDAVLHALRLNDVGPLCRSGKLPCGYDTLEFQESV